ncbi:Phosphoribosylaminoimidazole-succinocarboxamide synthase [Euzebya pacifica]|uniref:Phosphoribosylaminoimidazole-succinocarboxamide synthase n=1 Tax=Euzebya pacifica TaxID=1608957 RepID=A0A346Y4X9_9ACTN|nr:phosphoribosylaminoimidazolesuccinocarboxamide synthase [Euzebya pacifica]AXV09526.1 Phosphoribosylaminoimidazole-succinocarboxamide synthase [Euzebya pacifica]
MSELDSLAGLPGVTRLGAGKVREIFAVGEDQLLLVASDRISAFDVVMPTPIPDKGKVLTAMTAFWLQQLDDVVTTHLIATDPATFPEGLADHADLLAGRSMLCRRAQPLAIECVARGYLSGSGWKEYLADGTVCGIDLPEGLQESDRLPEVLFTPATKAELGDHDENIDFATAAGIVGREVADRVRGLTLELYGRAADHARQRGIILADTKFEFGLVDGEIVLIDEVLTPDSSRFWPADDYEPGRAQRSFDKQYVRDWLETLDWDKTPPGPELPDEIVQRTRSRYVEAYELLTGLPFSDWT